jgi:uncharacterized membrane protein
MKTENAILMKIAKESLKGKWGLAVGTYLVFTLICIIVSGIGAASGAKTEWISSLIMLLITGPFVLGLAIFSLAISRNKEAKLEQIFQGFNNFGKSLGAYLLMLLFILLWSLLLIIPGIIAGLSYSMTFYIIADNNSIGSMEAIDKSKAMMNGYKWKFFCLQLRFLGWGLLCLLTFGVGFLWLMPYMQISIAKFYDDIKEKQISKPVSPSDI